MLKFENVKLPVMETKDILVLVLVITVLAFRIYQRYVKKGKTGTTFSGNKSDRFSQPDKGEEYEPYSKK